MIESLLRTGGDGERSLLLTRVDTGVGLDAVRRGGVFASLFGRPSSEQDADGLFDAVEEIIGGAGGSILIRREPDGGTRFEIAFPLY